MRLEEVILFLGICVVLPVVVVALTTRAKTNATNKRAEIALAAIEKNTDVDLEELFRKMNLPRRSVKEKLLYRLLFGCIFTLLGAGIYVAMYVADMNGWCNQNMFISLSFVAVPALGIGLSFLINYWAGKSMLKKEMEIEAKNQHDA